MKKLKSTQKRLIQYLYSINSPFSAIELVDAFNCSTRTIYRTLNSDNATINNSSNLSDNNSNVKTNNLLIGGK